MITFVGCLLRFASLVAPSIETRNEGSSTIMVSQLVGKQTNEGDAIERAPPGRSHMYKAADQSGTSCCLPYLLTVLVSPMMASKEDARAM
jgi:hypothetical protein